MSRLFSFLIGLAASVCAATAAQADLLHPARAAHAPLMSYAVDSLHAEPGAPRLGGTLHRATDRATEIVMRAMGALDTPYRLGGTSVATGFDCSGFVRVMVEEGIGLKLPRTAAEQAAATQRIDKADLRPGDLVFFNTLRRSYSHVGIYLGDDKFIHAPRTGARVRVENMGTRYWQSRFNGARRVLHAELPKAVPGSLASLAGLGTTAAAAPESTSHALTATTPTAAAPATAGLTATAAVQAVAAGQGAQKLNAKATQVAKASGKATKGAKGTKTAKAGKASHKQAKASAAKTQTRTVKAGATKKGPAAKTTQTAKAAKAGAGKKSAAAKPGNAKRRA